MADSYVLLWLEAPLQSWGYESRFNRRETLGFPTRSGVLGLILCAMGAGGPQTEWLGKMSKYGQTVLAFSKKESSRKFRDNLKLVDFQMVGSAYDDSDPWQTLLIPKTIEGKKAVSGGTKLTYRYYLQDAKFAVIVCVPEELKETIKIGTAKTSLGSVFGAQVLRADGFGLSRMLYLRGGSQAGGTENS